MISHQFLKMYTCTFSDSSVNYIYGYSFKNKFYLDKNKHNERDSSKFEKEKSY